MKIIYDLGANNGDDIEYYLKKGERVVAVEANPELCQFMENRFSYEIQQGRLNVVNTVITNSSDQSSSVSFYIHKSDHVRSQFPCPENIEDFDEIKLPSISIESLLEKYGEPYYLKIDIENYDKEILRELFSLNVFPPYLSAESHDPQVLALILATGRYSGLKIVNGPTVHLNYRNCRIRTQDGYATYSFPKHSAGPFGEDLTGDWVSPQNFFGVIGIMGMGWKDIHATYLEKPESLSGLRYYALLLRTVFTKHLNSLRFRRDERKH